MEEKSLLGWKSNWLCGNGKHRINVKIILKVEVTIISSLFWTWRLILNNSLFSLLCPSLDSVLKTRGITLPTKVCVVKAVAFPIVVYGCESWTIKKAEHRRIDVWTVVLEKTLESPLDCKESQPVHSEGAQPWDFFGRNDAKAETPVLCPLDAKSWLIGKDSDAGRDWGQEEKGTTEDEMAGWHH